MTPIRWVLLCLLFTLYLLFGGSIFMFIEQHHEIHQKEELHVLRQDIQEILFRLDHNFYDNSTSPDILDALKSAKEGVVNRIAQVCQIDNLLEGPAPDTSSLKWNYYNSVFFAFTVVTTIGYGHLSPSTSLAKGLMILYALFGIPLNGILLSGIGDYFSNKIIKVHQKSKDKKHRGKSLTLIFEIIFYLIPGIIVFIIIPSGIFVLIENWSFLDSIYFAFVSLTTIGFGDYVAGMGDGHNIWLWLYKAFIIIWITFGLGYLIMILGFIAKGMKSKKVRGMLDKRLSGIRSTKEKLSKDIDYMRRIVNELYMMKIKPVYEVNGCENLEDLEDRFGSSIGNGRLRSRRPSCIRFDRRCSSLPRLTIHEEREEGRTNRAFEGDDGQQVVSPVSSGMTPTVPKSILKRRLSDSAINQLEWDDSIAHLRKSSISPEEMLETVVNALNGNMQNVINAVDELNKYEEDVANQEGFVEEEYPDEEEGGSGNTCDSATRNRGDIEGGLRGTSEKANAHDLSAQSWALRDVSESDEEGPLVDRMRTRDKAEQLECVVIHNKSNRDETDGIKSQTQSFMEKVGDALRKISGSGTPPETPRKISRNESVRKRKTSHESEWAVAGIRQPNHFQYSPFLRRHHLHQMKHSTLDQSHSDFEHSHQGNHYPHHHSLNPDPSEDVAGRKISQESTFSVMSNSSYQTIDEIISSARATRKNTPAHYHPGGPLPLPETDEVDGSVSINPGTRRASLESSTSSLVHFLKALDTVQDRLKKTSTCSNVSHTDSLNYSDDLSNSFGPSSAIKPIKPISKPGYAYAFKNTIQPVKGINRRRKNGIFQPGFSYTNFGYNAKEEEDESPHDEEGVDEVRTSNSQFSKGNSATMTGSPNISNNNGGCDSSSDNIKKR